MLGAVRLISECVDDLVRREVACEGRVDLNALFYELLDEGWFLLSPDGSRLLPT